MNYIFYTYGPIDRLLTAMELDPLTVDQADAIIDKLKTEGKLEEFVTRLFTYHSVAFIKYMYTVGNIPIPIELLEK
jgi:hypothetical protein